MIIGGVATGLKAAAKARRCDPRAEITVVEKGDLISYGACGLPYYVSAEVNAIEDLMKTPAGVLRTPAYFHDVKDITILTRTLVEKIDRQKIDNVYSFCPLRLWEVGFHFQRFGCREIGTFDGSENPVHQSLV